MVCPAPRGSRQGNRITAERWARILRGLGHHVRITEELADDDADVLVALHARRSAKAVRDYRMRHPQRPVVVALTGTDLYRDLERSRPAQRTLESADRLIVLQPAAVAHMPARARRRARVIYQSAVRHSPVRRRVSAPMPAHFDVCVLSHLRAVKDPLRAAYAARRLPAASRVRVLHAGRALSTAIAERARREMARNSRYRWLGERSHAAALAMISRARVVVLSSRLEGGANVIGEAAVNGVPVLASRVPGNVGLLGAGYEGLFPLGDTAALTDLLMRVETDPAFYLRLVRSMTALAPLFEPARERRAWRDLLFELESVAR